MLQMTNGAIVENYGGGLGLMNYNDTITTTNTLPLTNGTITFGSTSNCYPSYPTVYWNSYPVYVCTDKTKKAIEVLKALQTEKLLKCDSVPRFIALVEKISNLL